MSVRGVGIDVADATRFAHLAGSDHFVRSWFTPQEAARCRRGPDPALALAACWAVKEAVWKALAPAGWDGPLPWHDIEVAGGGVGVVLGGRPRRMAAGASLRVSVAVLVSRRVAVATCLLVA